MSQRQASKNRIKGRQEKTPKLKGTPEKTPMQTRKDSKAGKKRLRGWQ
jgi:hypothetical protein